jgi:hypothetical protein
VGNGAAAGIASLYYPSEDRTWTKTGQRWLTQVGLDGASNLIKEYWPFLNSKLFRRSIRLHDRFGEADVRTPVRRSLVDLRKNNESTANKEGGMAISPHPRTRIGSVLTRTVATRASEWRITAFFARFAQLGITFL